LLASHIPVSPSSTIDRDQCHKQARRGVLLAHARYLFDISPDQRYEMLASQLYLSGFVGALAWTLIAMCYVLVDEKQQS
jgi:hypothetical protein